MAKPDRTDDAGTHGPLSDRLDSWKEIASYLGRGVRTVQRWEREEQLPVHRLEHAKRGSVYAVRDELDRWWQSRQAAPTPSATTPTPPLPQPSPAPRVSETRAVPSLERVTNTSVVTVSPALSSDARMLVYLSDGGHEGAPVQLWLQQVGGSAMRLTSGMGDCADPSFSADDTTVLFTARGEGTLNVYAVPTLGGAPRLVKRNARSARMSPDGAWLAYLSLQSQRGVRLDRTDGGGERTIAEDLTDVSSAVWSPDSRHLMVRAHADAQFERDFWIVPLDGGPVTNTGIVGKFRARGTVLDSPPVWVRNGIVFSGAGRDGALLWHQRIAPDTFAAIDDPHPLTRGTEWASFPTAAGGRLAFVNTNQDMNLWSLPLDHASGTTHGSPRRLTRGPTILGHLSLAPDGRTLAYFSVRTGMPNIFLRNLDDGSETMLAVGPPQPKGFPVISPSGRRLAHGTLAMGARAVRPIFIVDLDAGTSRQLCEDCGGRPRHWLDESSILVETFGSRLNSLIVVDAASGEQRPLLASADRSVANPSVSSDGAWVAFDASNPGGSPSVFVAPLGRADRVLDSDWIVIEENASHPCWSRDGELLYFLPATPNRDLRGAVHARRLDAASKRPLADPFVAAALTEFLVPTFIAGTAPIVAHAQIVIVLADVRGDIWMMDI